MSRIPQTTLAELRTLNPTLYKTLKGVLDGIGNQLNQLTEGRIVCITNAQDSEPTTGQYEPGDFVKNSDRSEAGSPGSKYILDGWECATSDPLTWYERRLPTGN